MGVNSVATTDCDGDFSVRCMHTVHGSYSRYPNVSIRYHKGLWAAVNLVHGKSRLLIDDDK